MSLIGALNTGQSALAAAQAAIQVAGNNISNSSNENYAVETLSQTPAPDQVSSGGVAVGTGVDLTSVQRQVDNALQNRLNGSISDNQSAQTTEQWLTQVQSVFNALGTSNLSTSMTNFNNSWSTLAGSPQDSAQREVVVQAGQSLAQQYNSQIQQLQALGSSVTTELGSSVQQANTLASQVATLNQQIVVAEGSGSGSANSLEDQRDATLQQLSQLMNINTVQQSNGSVDVYVGSQPLVSGAASNGVSLVSQDSDGTVAQQVIFSSNNGAIPLNGGGQLGSLSDMQARIDGVENQENTLANNLIYQVNKVYSSGQGLEGFTGVTATNAVANNTQPLSSAAAGLTNPPTNGSFVVTLTNTSTGQSTSTLVQVNLTGSPTDTTLDSLTASLNGIDGVQASDTNGTLSLATTASDEQMTFSQDSSGVLASLGVNTFFTGSDATDIGVNNTVASNTNLLAAAKNGDPTDNQTALALAALSSQPVAALNGSSLDDSYQSMINGVANQVATATSNASASQAVQTTLQNQRDSLSGVSLDDETINLMKFQQGYQVAAQLINVVNTLMQTLLTTAAAVT